MKKGNKEINVALRIQITNDEKDISVFIKTSRNKHDKAIPKSSTKKNDLTQKVTSNPDLVVKWRLFRLILVVIMKIYGFFVKQN